MTNRLILAVCAGLLGAAIAAPSDAADLRMPTKAPYQNPVYVAPFSWTGFYVGINGGYGWGKSDWSSPVTRGNPSPKGSMVGGTFGYNLQTGQWVYGVEGDIDVTWIRDGDGSGTGACFVACETKNSWLATARGRVGYAWDRWLPYITGGAAFGDIKMEANTGATSSTTKVGWTAGGGVEYAFLGAWSAKVEYLYADLGKATCGAGTCGVATDATYKTNIMRAGVNLRF